MVIIKIYREPCIDSREFWLSEHFLPILEVKKQKNVKYLLTA